MKLKFFFFTSTHLIRIHNRNLSSHRRNVQNRNRHLVNRATLLAPIAMLTELYRWHFPAWLSSHRCRCLQSSNRKSVRMLDVTYRIPLPNVRGFHRTEKCGKKEKLFLVFNCFFYARDDSS